MKSHPKAQEKGHKSMSALARKLSVSRSTLYEWRAQGAPVEKGEGAVISWAMSEAKRGNDSDGMRAAKLAVLRQTERRLKIANDTKAGALMSVEDAKRQNGEAWVFVFSALEQWQRELPPMLAGLSAVEISLRLKSFAEVMRAQAKAKFEGAGKIEDVVEQVATSAAVETLSARAFNERCETEWRQFMDWRRAQAQADDEKRAAWCRQRAAAGLPVPDASDAELAAHPGLKRA